MVGGSLIPWTQLLLISKVVGSKLREDGDGE